MEDEDPALEELNRKLQDNQADLSSSEEAELTDDHLSIKATMVEISNTRA